MEDLIISKDMLTKLRESKTFIRIEDFLIFTEESLADYVESVIDDLAKELSSLKEEIES